VLGVPYHYAKFGGALTSHSAGVAKNVQFTARRHASAVYAKTAKHIDFIGSRKENHTIA